MGIWPRKLRKESALRRLLARLEYEGFIVEHDHDGSGKRPIRYQRQLLGHVDHTGCFIPLPGAKGVPAVKRVIELVNHLRERQGLAVSVQL